MQVEQAQMDDVANIVKLFEAAAVWLEEQGVKQWPRQVSPRFRLFLQKKVEGGEVFVVRGIDGRLLAHIRFDYEAGSVWHNNPIDTAYVRGLVIANEMRGQGLGANLLAWAQGHARKRDCDRLRLDCLAANGRLRQYYSDCGFTYLGEGRHSRYVAALFEMMLQGE